MNEDKLYLCVEFFDGTTYTDEDGKPAKGMQSIIVDCVRFEGGSACFACTYDERTTLHGKPKWVSTKYKIKCEDLITIVPCFLLKEQREKLLDEYKKNPPTKIKQDKH